MALAALYKEVQEELGKVQDINLQVQEWSLREMVDSHETVDFNHIPETKRNCISALVIRNPATFRYSINIGELELVYSVMHESGGAKEKARVEHILRLVSIWMKVATRYTKTSCFPRNVRFFCYLLKCPKIFPARKNGILGEEDVNSAFTYACAQQSGHGSRNSICVFREEELFKVLLHECIHLIGFDVSYVPPDPSEDSRISQIFEIPAPAGNSNTFNFDESYTEFLATIVQCMFLSQRGNWSEFLEAIDVERDFAVTQASNILSYSNLSYSALVGGTKPPLTPYNESTAVFAYYILKCILLWHYTDLFDQHITKLSVFSETTTRKRVLDFILEKAKEASFVGVMEEKVAFLSKLELPICGSSLCMTFHGCIGGGTSPPSLRKQITIIRRRAI
jgi:hypothetical protein